MNADSTELQNFSEFNNLRNLRHIQFQPTATKSRAEKQSFFDEKIPFENISLKLNGLEIKNADESTKHKMSNYLKENSKIFLDVNLGMGEFSSIFWGCDLTEEYIKENAYYTT